jgi:hypothetical protein
MLHESDLQPLEKTTAKSIRHRDILEGGADGRWCAEVGNLTPISHIFGGLIPGLDLPETIDFTRSSAHQREPPNPPLCGKSCCNISCKLDTGGKVPAMNRASNRFLSAGSSNLHSEHSEHNWQMPPSMIG